MKPQHLDLVRRWYGFVHWLAFVYSMVKKRARITHETTVVANYADVTAMKSVDRVLGRIIKMQ